MNHASGNILTRPWIEVRYCKKNQFLNALQLLKVVNNNSEGEATSVANIFFLFTYLRFLPDIGRMERRKHVLEKSINERAEFECFCVNLNRY